MLILSSVLIGRELLIIYSSIYTLILYHCLLLILRLLSKAIISLYVSYKKLYIYMALAGVAQCIECQPENQRIAGLIPSQGTCLGCGPGPWLGTTQEATTH